MKFNNKVLIVGCGAITSTFHLPALQKFIASNNIFLYDKDFDTAKKLGNKFGIDNIIANLEDDLSYVDSSILAVPYQYSFDLTKKLLLSKINVLGEKPIASSSSELNELISLSEANNLVFCGNHTRRFFPSIIKLKKLLEGKNIKEINIYEGDPFSWKSKSGFYFEGKNGVLMDRGPHIINVINFITNHIELNPISFNHNSQSELPESHCKISLKSKNYDVNIIISWIYKMSNQIEIITDNEIFQVGISSFNFINQKDNNTTKNITAKPIKTQFNQFSDNVIEEFLKQVNYGTSNSVLASDIKQSVDLIEKLYSLGTNFNEK
tara:strand:+ start:19342 stop:20307 length:966 start_codon:yes stop_codon:yes gene_type:complete